MAEQPEQELHVAVIPASRGEDCTVVLSFSDQEADSLDYLLPAAEYLMYEVARRSALGFEKALDRLAEGAMTWRTRKETPDA